MNNYLSLCMIVKNEEKNLARCLDSAKSIVDEIVIVDTGSTDATKEIASIYTNKIYDYQWDQDFSRARNEALKHASNDFVLVLDADEIIIECDIVSIKQLLQKYRDGIGRFILCNEFTRDGRFYKNKERLGRVFSKEYYDFQGAIHEQLTPIQEFSKRFYNVPMEVLHIGYNGNIEERRNKADRNISLLLKELQNKPNNTYILYQLAKSYFMIEEYVQAGKFFEQAFEYDLDTQLEYVQDMVETYGYTLLNTKQYEKAKELLKLYNEFSDSADFIFVIALILMNNGYLLEAITEFLKATKIKECKVEGVNNYLAFYNIGVIYECIGNKKSAIEYYKKCNNYTLAIERMKVYCV